MVIESRPADAAANPSREVGGRWLAAGPRPPSAGPILHLEAESIMSRNSAAVLTAILAAGIWFSCPAAKHVQSPWAVGAAAFLIAYPIYRLAYRGPDG
jgi:hypothetical protein